VLKPALRILLIFYSLQAAAQPSAEALMSFLRDKDPLIQRILSDREKYRLQFMVSAIEHSPEGNVSFRDYSLQSGQYFYPASMVKLPTALVCLELLDSLQIPLSAFLEMNDDAGCGKTSFSRMTRQKPLPFTEIMEDMISISNNPYYSLLFHFAGPKVLNERMRAIGMKETRIFSAFTSCPKRADITTSSCFIRDAQKPLFQKAAETYPYSAFRDFWPLEARKRLGKNGPSDTAGNGIDFNQAHEYGLEDIHNTMKRLLFPESFPQEQRFRLSGDSRNFILSCLAKYPREMNNSNYHNLRIYPDNYYKYSIIGEDNQPVSDPRYRIFSKIGLAYGFVTETAYVVDFVSGKDFLLTLSMYVKENSSSGEGRYSYNSVARPFLSRFSKGILEFLKREMPHNHCPDYYLESLQMLMFR